MFEASVSIWFTLTLDQPTCCCLLGEPEGLVMSHSKRASPRVIYSKLPGEVEFCACQGRKDTPNLVIQELSFKGLQRHLTLSLITCKTSGLPERLVYLIPEGTSVFLLSGIFNLQDLWCCWAP